MDASVLLAEDADSETNDPARLPYQGSSELKKQQGNGKSNSSRKGAKKHPRKAAASKAASPKSIFDSEKQNQGDGQSGESMLEMIRKLILE